MKGRTTEEILASLPKETKIQWMFRFFKNLANAYVCLKEVTKEIKDMR